MLIPKKNKEVIKLVSTELNISEELADAVVSHYWKRVRKSMVDLEHHAIFVEGLGTFKVKHWKLPDIIQKYTNYMNAIGTKTFNIMAIRQEIVAKVDGLKRLLNLFNEESKKKQLVKDRRYGKDKESMEVQK